MAEVHGAKGTAVVEHDPGGGFVNSKVVFNVHRWSLEISHELADNTKLAGVIPTPAAAPLWHTFADLGCIWSGRVEGFLDNVAVTGVPDITKMVLEPPTIRVTLMDGDGGRWQGNCLVRDWRAENDRSDLSKFTAELQGSGTLTYTVGP